MTNFVLDELVRNHKSVWEAPSFGLKFMCEDVGCIQHGHHELADLIEDHNMEYLIDCVQYKCENCRQWGFPCDNLAEYGFQNSRLARQWDAQFD